MHLQETKQIVREAERAESRHACADVEVQRVVFRKAEISGLMGFNDVWCF